jgi:hypothetical protein
MADSSYCSKSDQSQSWQTSDLVSDNRPFRSAKNRCGSRRVEKSGWRCVRSNPVETQPDRLDWKIAKAVRQLREEVWLPEHGPLKEEGIHYRQAHSACGVKFAAELFDELRVDIDPRRLLFLDKVRRRQNSGIAALDYFSRDCL